MSYTDQQIDDAQAKVLNAQLSTQEFKEQFDRAEVLSKILINHMSNDKGELLARVEENSAFQEIYDYRGGQKYQHRLDRKREQVAFDYSSRTHLFQKVYYATGLTSKDERALRAAFNASNNSHELQSSLTKAAMFVGFWPLAYKMSRTARPSSVFLFGAAYYACYQYAVVPFGMQMLQNNLNAAARPFAERYQITEA